MNHFSHQQRAEPASSECVSRERLLPAVDHHQPRLLVVLEGQHDCEFLRRIATVLRRAGENIPDLVKLEAQGTVILLPIGGGNLALWSQRLAPLHLPELHLYDREQSPETEVRQAIVRRINQRAGCQAVLTGKRSLENYLHATAIRSALGIDLEFGDETPMAEALARRCHQLASRGSPWEALPRTAQKKQVHRAKRWLNLRATTHMTLPLLAQRDPRGEIRSWLTTIDGLLSGARED